MIDYAKISKMAQYIREKRFWAEWQYIAQGVGSIPGFWKMVGLREGVNFLGRGLRTICFSHIPL